MHGIFRLNSALFIIFFSSLSLSLSLAYARKKEKEKKMLTCYVTAVQYEWMNNRERRGSNFDSRYKAISDRYKKMYTHIFVNIPPSSGR